MNDKTKALLDAAEKVAHNPQWAFQGDMDIVLQAAQDGLILAQAISSKDETAIQAAHQSLLSTAEAWEIWKKRHPVSEHDHP